MSSPNGRVIVVADAHLGQVPPTVGEAFNPYIHEAIEAVENSDQPEGTIVEEVLKGYKLGDETLRPARVRVSAGNKPAP